MPKVTDTPDGLNKRTLEAAKSGRITTLEELLDFCQVDRNVWETERHTLNTWEGFSKDNDGNPVVTTLHQVKAYLRRRVLEAEHPPIQPVEIAGPTHPTYKKPHRPYGIKRAVILSDAQVGFVRDLRTGKLSPSHDRLAMDIALQLIYDLRPHYVINVGDILDLPDFGSYAYSPELANQTQSSVVEAAWWLGRIRQAVPRAVCHLLLGNHDQRLEKAIINNLKAAYGLRPADELDLPPALSVPRLLALHKTGWNYSDGYPNGEYFLTPNLKVIHGDTVRGGGGNTTAAIVKKEDVSVICGHIHRLESAYRTKSNGDVISAHSVGCMCLPELTPPGRKRQDWQSGLGVVHFLPDGSRHHIELIHIDQGRAIYGGKEYVGEARISELEQDTGWTF